MKRTFPFILFILSFLVETIKQVLNQIQISGMITYLRKKKNLSRNDVIMISNFSLLYDQQL